MILTPNSIAQFYISCGQLNVTGGGSGKPGPLVSIPGVYTGTVSEVVVSWGFIVNLVLNVIRSPESSLTSTIVCLTFFGASIAIC